ncbi:putative oxidoreductase [Clostridium bornimense]|uniref:Putative oxidoreductase n=1 Tax=Clostridium bornimense TaxID=1216932 RepID=W6S0D9_9CLOT|nr:FAD-dependent oxidoreductase [Clostridium bornimense]CDM70213.1 putative oxidoreductase [Clostridium bornimense]
MREYELIIIGGGAAGMLAAIEGKKKGINEILVIEKDPILGGNLNSADYPINKDRTVTGKEYKVALLDKFNKLDIEVKLNTLVLKIEEKDVLCTSEINGIEKIRGKSIIIANGGKEGGRKAVDMVGDRCSGIYTLSMAKKIFALDRLPGKNILIYGNSTLYMIKDKLKEKGLNIAGIVIKDNSNETYDLSNNIYKDYNIASIEGEGRVSSVKLIKDNDIKTVLCDTVIFSMPMLSDGLVAMRSGIRLNPKTTGAEVNDNFETSKEGIYAIGNGIYIHNSIEEIEKECSKVIKNIVKVLEE